MTRAAKLVATFLAARRTFDFQDFVRILRSKDYSEVKSQGHTRGAGRTYYSPTFDDMIKLHEPHDGLIQGEMLKRLQRHLTEKNIL